MNVFFGSSLVLSASILIYYICIHLTNKKPLKPYTMIFTMLVSGISIQVNLLIPVMITRWVPTKGLMNR